MPITTGAPAWRNTALESAETSVAKGWSNRNEKDREQAAVQATIGLAREVEQLRETLADLLGAHGPLAGFLDELVVRIAPQGDSITEALVQVANAIDNHEGSVPEK